MRLTSLLICLMLATSSQADISRPDTLADTLEIIDEAVRAAGFDDVSIDRADSSVLVKMPDGSIFTLSPDNLHLNLQSASDDIARQSMVDTMVATLRATTSQPDTASFTQDQILPRLQHIDFVQANPDFQYLPFAGNLVVTYVVDFPTHTSSLHAEDMTAQSLSLADVQTIAIDNLIAASQSMTIEGSTSGIYYLAFDGFYENALMLDSEMWDNITTQLGPLAVTVPTRDLVMFVPRDDAALVRSMTSIRDQALSDSAYTISEQMFTWDAGQWVVLPE